MEVKLAFFDFDGTITKNDSMVDFIQYAVGKINYYFGLIALSPMLSAYIFRIVSNNLAKEKLIAHFFKSWDADNFKILADRYARERIDKITRLDAMEKIKWHQKQGHKVIIVSASVECWLKGWCEKHNIDLIATRLEIQDSKLTGKFATKNCYGKEKASRVKNAYDLSQCDHIYAYGDSRGDKELLALADEAFYKPFRA